MLKTGLPEEYVILYPNAVFRNLQTSNRIAMLHNNGALTDFVSIYLFFRKSFYKKLYYKIDMNFEFKVPISSFVFKF